uniref:NADH-ubiquinone oxidoreductase chain 6 n=1 Tax=Pycnoscelus femapterus TaxID=2093448 RepID=A0A2P1H7K3_9NEOP|nr:NADH dehydrogenase subunit 6 [Pycnoscelus femapterus]
MMFTISLILSTIFIQIYHPLAMGLILLLQTVMISIITGMMNQSFWFSYVLFLIFLGGMLVLFIYITSLASNEMFSMSTKILFSSILISLSIMTMMKLQLNIKNQENMNFLINNSMTYTLLIKLYSTPTSIITILLATYLFLTLIATVKITSIFKGPLRQSN